MRLDINNAIWESGLPWCSVVKNLPACVQDTGSFPGSGRSLGEGNGDPLQYSCPGNHMDRRACPCSCCSVASFVSNSVQRHRWKPTRLPCPWASPGKNTRVVPSPMHESEKWKWSGSVVSDLQRPPGLQPSRLLRPWDFPGKSTGVGCHCYWVLKADLFIHPPLSVNSSDRFSWPFSEVENSLKTARSFFKSFSFFF